MTVSELNQRIEALIAAAKETVTLINKLEGSPRGRTRLLVHVTGQPGPSR